MSSRELRARLPARIRAFAEGPRFVRISAWRSALPEVAHEATCFVRRCGQALETEQSDENGCRGAGGGRRGAESGPASRHAATGCHLPGHPASPHMCSPATLNSQMAATGLLGMLPVTNTRVSRQDFSTEHKDGRKKPKMLCTPVVRTSRASLRRAQVHPVILTHSGRNYSLKRFIKTTTSFAPGKRMA